MSDLPLLSNSSISSHSLSHNSALAFSVSLLSSLFSCLYFTCPSSVRLLFHFLLSPIFCNISSVTHGFFASFPFLKPTYFLAFVNILSFNAIHFPSAVRPALGRTSVSIQVRKASLRPFSLSTSPFLRFLPPLFSF